MKIKDITSTMTTWQSLDYSLIKLSMKLEVDLRGGVGFLVTEKATKQ